MKKLSFAKLNDFFAAIAANYRAGVIAWIYRQNIKAMILAMAAVGGRGVIAYDFVRKFKPLKIFLNIGVVIFAFQRIVIRCNNSCDIFIAVVLEYRLDYLPVHIKGG
jgi:hypothetical protein